MADILRVTSLIDGIQRTVNLSQNALVVGSLKVGTVSPTELTKTILDRLLAAQNGSDLDATYHTHNSQYFTETELSQTSGTTGSDLIGDDDSYSNFTPTAATIKGALSGIDAALASAGGTAFSDTDFEIYDNSDSTKKIKFEASGITTDTTRIITMPDASVNLGLIATAIQSSEKGANSGVATLDAGGKIPVAQLPSSVMTYEGTWNADTNTPTLEDGTGDAGMVYLVSVGGDHDFGSGTISFSAGDWAVYNGSIWEKSVNSNSVVSVNGQTGVVVLDTDDVSEGTNQYFTEARARTAVIAASIADSDTTHSPSGEAVYEALLLKQDASAALDEAETFFSNTDFSAANANQLINGDNADSLHKHASVAKTASVGESFDTSLYAVRYAKSGDDSFVAGRMYKADIDASSDDNFYVIGLVKAEGALVAGDSVTVIKSGEITATSHGFTVGMPVFLGADGVVTQNSPSGDQEAVVRVGIAVDANTIEVNIQTMGVI